MVTTRKLQRLIFLLFLASLILSLWGCSAGPTTPSPEAAVPAATTAVAQPTATSPAATATSTEAPPTLTDTLPPPTDTSPPPTDTPIPATNTLPPATATQPPTATDTPLPPTATPPPALTRVLSLQSPRLQGEDVLLLQQRLVELGYTEVGEPDGIFGGMTQTAVVRFQSDSGLSADGIVGQATWTALWGGEASPVSAVPTPTSAYAVSHMMPSPFEFVQLISFDGDVLWIAGADDKLVRYDPETGKTLKTYRIGCEVCYGGCEFFAAGRDGKNFWALQYGDTKELDCNVDNPWTNVGFTLRKFRPENESREMINVSQYISEPPVDSAVAAYGDTVWVSMGSYILVVDVDKSDDEKVVLAKTVYPGIYTEALLYANDVMWAAGEALVAIDPETYQTISIYPFAATSLVFDGDLMWGASRYEWVVRSLDLSTRQVSPPIPLENAPTAIAFDGKNLWVAFEWAREMAIIPIK